MNFGFDKLNMQFHMVFLFCLILHSIIAMDKRILNGKRVTDFGIFFCQNIFRKIDIHWFSPPEKQWGFMVSLHHRNHHRKTYSPDNGPVFVFQIFSLSSLIISHKINWHKIKLSNLAKLQFLNDETEQNTNFAKLTSANSFF